MPALASVSWCLSPVDNSILVQQFRKSLGLWLFIKYTTLPSLAPYLPLRCCSTLAIQYARGLPSQFLPNLCLVPSSSFGCTFLHQYTIFASTNSDCQPVARAIVHSLSRCLVLTQSFLNMVPHMHSPARRLLWFLSKFV